MLNHFSRGVAQVVGYNLASLVLWDPFILIALLHLFTNQVRISILPPCPFSGIITLGMVFLTDSPPHLLEEGFFFTGSLITEHFRKPLLW